MNLRPAIAALLAAAATAWGEAPGELFRKAGDAYDKGQFAEASSLYAQLMADGWISAPLFFNAGDAAFRRDDLGTAVLMYRRAWSLAPRDAEIGANLHFALQRAGAAENLLRPWEGAMSRLTLTEWVVVATAGFWLGIGAWGFWLARGRSPRARRLAVALGVLALLGCAGIGFWLDWRARPEWVVLRPGQQALFAPLESATPHFALPPGSIVRVRESAGDWLRIVSGRDEGWVRRAACEPVRPAMPSA